MRSRILSRQNRVTEGDFVKGYHTHTKGNTEVMMQYLLQGNTRLHYNARQLVEQ